MIYFTQIEPFGPIYPLQHGTLSGILFMASICGDGQETRRGTRLRILRALSRVAEISRNAHEGSEALHPFPLDRMHLSVFACSEDVLVGRGDRSCDWGGRPRTVLDGGRALGQVV